MVEVVLTLVLLSGAGYMMRSFLSLYQMRTGFNATNLLAMDLYLPLTKYPEPGPRDVIFQQFADRLAPFPAMQASALTNHAPLNGAPSSRVGIDGVTPPDGQQGQSRKRRGSRPTGYFDALGIQLRRGRTFKRDDGLPGKGAADRQRKVRRSPLRGRGSDRPTDQADGYTES